MTENPDYAVTRRQMQELDRLAIEQYEIPGILLMENAGRACAQTALDMLGDAEEPEVVVLCGRGNNGGDGFVVARHLVNRGVRGAVLLLGTVADVLDGAGDPAINLRILRNMDVSTVELGAPPEIRSALEEKAGANLIVDALLGTGISGEVREPFDAAIRAVNRMDAPTLAVDVPSGLDCDTGLPLGVAVRAERTVTFGLPKQGLLRPEAAPYTGRLEVAEISIPRVLIERNTQQWHSEGG